MTVDRVAGTPEARKAWMILRGPYALAYLAIGISALVIEPTSRVGIAWTVVALLLTVILLTGSFASYMVTGHKKVGRHWMCAELLEVTGLQLLAATEIAFFFWSMLETQSLPFFSFYHLSMAGFAFGIWRNMTWRRQRINGSRHA